MKCPDCYKSEGRKLERGITFEDFGLYDRSGRRVAMGYCNTIDAGPCDTCKGKGVVPSPDA